MEGRLRRYQDRLEHRRLRLLAVSPAYRLRQQRQRHGELQDRLVQLMEGKLAGYQHRLALAAERLHGQSPLTRLASGYSYVADQDGRNVKSVEQVQEGDCLQIHMTDGVVRARAESVERSMEWQQK